MSDPVLRLSGIEKGYNRGQPNEVVVLRGAELTVGLRNESGSAAGDWAVRAV